MNLPTKDLYMCTQQSKYLVNQSEPADCMFDGVFPSWCMLKQRPICKKQDLHCTQLQGLSFGSGGTGPFQDCYTISTKQESVPLPDVTPQPAPLGITNLSEAHNHTMRYRVSYNTRVDIDHMG